METLVAVAQLRNQYYYSNGASLSNPIRDITCRTFQSGSGLLPSPFKPFYATPQSKKTPTCSKTHDHGKTTSPIPISFKGRCSRENDPSLSELWAGPAYSNSPPPNSLPIPTFSVRPKRTVSLELPKVESDMNFQPMSKSAPASPTRGNVGFLCKDDFATMTLRRILNLDVVDD